MRFVRPLLLLLSAVSVLLSPLDGATPPAKRPNILFILLDDQSPFDLRAYEPTSALRTPVLDRLAARGVVLDGAYHMGAGVGGVCTPSRHMIMSGRTLWHLPASAGGPPRNLCPPDLPQFTLPAVFNRAGYATMRTCKTGNSYEAANQLFTVRKDAMRRGPTDDTGSAWHAEQVLAYLGQRAATKDPAPFFIYFGFSHPHDTRDGKPDLLARYGAVNHTDPDQPPATRADTPKLPVGYLPAHQIPHGHPGLRDEVAVSGVWERRDERTIRNETGRQFACSDNIDTQIGRVLDRLAALGELENTYIIYTADHGMAIGRHGLQGKQNLYEHTWRVPFIAAGPGLPAGRRAQGNVYLLDVLATLCDFAGIAPPASNEGLSFRSVLEGRQAAVRDVLYGCYNGGTKPGLRAVRRGDWKLVQWDVLDGSVRRTQLFNLAENPREFLREHHDPALVALTGVRPAAHQVDLSADPRYAGQLAEMQALLLAEMRRLDDPWRLWNQPSDNLPPPPEPARAAAKKKKV